MKFLQILCLSTAMLLTMSSCAQKAKKQKQTTSKNLSRFSQATFAAGCFWHEEAMFESIKGVQEVVSGYAGGKISNPTYQNHGEGAGSHAETVNVYYDSSLINYPTLLKIYFSGQDPTSSNGQHPDYGPQYRSVLFYRNNTEKILAENYIKQLNVSGKYKKPIAVQVVPFIKFWIAEDYHQDYIKHNPDQRYIQSVSIPEIRKVQKEYPNLVKPGHVY